MDREEHSVESPESQPPTDRPKLQRRWEFADPTVVQARLLRRQILSWVAVVGLVVTVGGTWVGISAEERARERSYRAAVEADIGRLVAAQQAHFDTHARFASLEDLDIDYISGQGVRVTIHHADSSGWSAGAWHLRISYACAITISMPLDPERDPPRPDCR